MSCTESIPHDVRNAFLSVYAVHTWLRASLPGIPLCMPASMIQHITIPGSSITGISIHGTVFPGFVSSMPAVQVSITACCCCSYPRITSVRSAGKSAGAFQGFPSRSLPVTAGRRGAGVTSAASDVGNGSHAPLPRASRKMLSTGEIVLRWREPCALGATGDATHPGKQRPRSSSRERPPVTRSFPRMIALGRTMIARASPASGDGSTRLTHMAWERVYGNAVEPRRRRRKSRLHPTFAR